MVIVVLFVEEKLERMKVEENKRIGNFEFAPATYLIPLKVEPEFPTFNINYYTAPGTKIVIASYDWDEDGYYELRFIGNRPFHYVTEETLKDFWEILQYSYKMLVCNE